MTIAMRSYLTAGVALVGAATVVVTPVTGPTSTGRASSVDYSLTAASTPLSNVPVNMFNMILSIPAWEVQAMDRLADAMVATGSWQVWGPTNVFGFDEQDPPKLAALIDMLVPIRPFSSALGDQLNWWAKANLPMNAGCAAAQNACPDPKAMLNSMFTVPRSELFGGYQFPVVTNPFTGQPTSWSEQYVKLNRGGAFTALRGYLTAPPVGVETVSAAEASAAVSRLSKSIVDAFDPFVQNSQWFDTQHTVLAPLFRALAPVLCASCDPANPYDNEWLNNYPQKPAAGVNPAASVSEAAVVIAQVANGSADNGSTVPAGASWPKMNEPLSSAISADTDSLASGSKDSATSIERHRGDGGSGGNAATAGAIGEERVLRHQTGKSDTADRRLSRAPSAGRGR